MSGKTSLVTFTFLLGLVASHSTVLAADGAGSGPVAALEQARAAAAAESQHAARTDAAAADALGAAPVGASGSIAGGEDPPKNAPTNEPPTDAASADASAAAADATASYDPSGHRDPFRPPNLTPKVADRGPRTPLEGYEIGQLRLVGIVSSGPAARAMVEDSVGLGYIVTPGTAIGSSGGVVRRIEPRRVLIEEMTTTYAGDKQAREVVMELPQEDRSP